MTARDDYPLLATAERLEEFGEAHRALDEIDWLRTLRDEFLAHAIYDETRRVYRTYLTAEIFEAVLRQRDSA